MKRAGMHAQRISKIRAYPGSAPRFSIVLRSTLERLAHPRRPAQARDLEPGRAPSYLRNLTVMTHPPQPIGLRLISADLATPSGERGQEEDHEAELLDAYSRAV